MLDRQAIRRSPSLAALLLRKYRLTANCTARDADRYCRQQIFASAIGQLIAYCAVFVILRFRLPIQPRMTSRDLLTFARQPVSSPTRGLVLTPSSSPSRSYAASTYTPPTYQGHGLPPSIGRPTTSASTLRRKIDKTSLVMLAYPLVNLSVILPLSIYRLSALAGRPGGPTALAACGFIFALGGFANVLLYSFTRVSGLVDFLEILS